MELPNPCEFACYQFTKMHYQQCEDTLKNLQFHDMGQAASLKMEHAQSVIERISCLYSRTPFLMERPFLLFRRGSSTPILCPFLSNLIDISGQSQPCIKGHPKIMGSINTVDRLPKKLNWLGCAYQRLRRSLRFLWDVDGDPPFYQPRFLVAEILLQVVDEQRAGGTWL